ncbi:MAG: cytochrome D1 domain-containing protein, partial [Rubrivivax sp.]
MNNRREALLALASLAALASGCAVAPPRGSGDLGVVVQRERGALTVVDTSARTVLGEIGGLGDLSHASVVFARDGATAYVFGRDGALSKVN